MKKLIIFTLIISSAIASIFAQSVGIGQEKFTPDKSAALEIQSNHKGLLIPRLVAAQRNAITEPAQGLLIFQTDTISGFYYYSGDTWYLLNDSGNDTDTDPRNELQTISLEGNTLTLSDGNSIKFQTLEIQEYQSLTIIADSLKISNGNYVLIPQPDNLGNHTATQNIQTGGNYISSDGDNEGIFIDPDGTVNIIGIINLGTNAVQTSEIENNAITTSKIADGQVTISKLSPLVPLGFSYKGGWDANTNTPTLSNGSGSNSDYYTVATAGTINIGDGVTLFNIGDWVVYNGSHWVKLNNAETTQTVTTVFGRSGDIIPQIGDYSWNQITKTGSSISDIDDISVGIPANGQLLVRDGTVWRNRSVTGDILLSNLGVAEINTGSVGLNNLYNSSSIANTIMYWNGTTWSETLINNIEGDGDITNELISGANLTGTMLQITDAGQTWPVDLSSLILAGSDDQTLTAPILTGTTLTLGIEDGNTVGVNLIDLQDGVDDADASITNEVITNALLAGTELRIIEAGETHPVDLSSLITVDTDDQNLTGASLSGTTLTIEIEDGNSTSVNLLALQDGVDDADASITNEVISNAWLAGTDLRITEAGETHEVDLSSLSASGSDDQNLTSASLSGTTLTIAIEDGNSTSVNLLSLQDGVNDADASITNEVITSVVLDGTDLEITEAGSTHTIGLGGLATGGTDDQNLTSASLSGTTLTIGIEDGNSTSVNLSSLQDGFTDADASITNEVITNAVLVGSELRITEAGDVHPVDLSSLSSGGTDDQNLTSASLSGTTLTIAIEDGNSTSVDLLSIQDGFTDADASATNEVITEIFLDGDELQITEAGVMHPIDLSSLSASSSDRRLKENFIPTKFGLSHVMNLSVLDYDFISGNKHQTGLVAQDLFEVFPSAVVVGGDNYKTDPWKIRYDMLTPLLIKSTQELNNKITSLEESNKMLINENQELMNKLEILEEKVDQLLKEK